MGGPIPSLCRAGHRGPSPQPWSGTRGDPTRPAPTFQGWLCRTSGTWALHQPPASTVSRSPPSPTWLSSKHTHLQDTLADRCAQVKTPGNHSEPSCAYLGLRGAGRCKRNFPEALVGERGGTGLGGWNTPCGEPTRAAAGLPGGTSPQPRPHPLADRQLQVPPHRAWAGVAPRTVPRGEAGNAPSSLSAPLISENGAQQVPPLRCSPAPSWELCCVDWTARQPRKITRWWASTPPHHVLRFQGLKEHDPQRRTSCRPPSSQPDASASGPCQAVGLSIQARLVPLGTAKLPLQPPRWAHRSCARD